MPLSRYIEHLEALYGRYNHRRFVHPDPLEVLYRYDDPADREIAAFIAASLAYGRVAQILRSVNTVLERMQPAPARFLFDSAPAKLERTFADFRHRFQTGRELSAMLIALRTALREYGSLEQCFMSGADRGSENTTAALSAFVRYLDRNSGGRCGHLLSDPAKGSACKRMNLLLRWMVRQDAVDVGHWHGVDPAMLIVPLDTHMHRIARKLGATVRKQANLATAVEITEAFRRVSPRDPVKYDFALTRLGIRDDTDAEEFFDEIRYEKANA